LICFNSLFKGDRALWTGAWIFHVVLALIAFGHIRVFTDFPVLWAAVGLSKEGVDTMSATIGGIAGIVVMLAVGYLLLRRFAVERTREISGFTDYFSLLLLLAVIITGNSMRFGAHFDLNQTREYFWGLLTFSAAPVPASGMFLLHLLLAQLLIISIPFSKILHMGGFFFTHALIRR
jgi:nitrate reductase gamma subunit